MLILPIKPKQAEKQYTQVAIPIFSFVRLGITTKINGFELDDRGKKYQLTPNDSKESSTTLTISQPDF